MNEKDLASLHHSRVYDNFLMHWKYIKREKVGDKWKYTYKDDLKNASSAVTDKIKNVPKAVTVKVAENTEKVKNDITAMIDQQKNNAKEAVKAMGLSVEVEYITDMQKVMEYGVMSMPAVVVNEKVVSTGKVLKAADVEKLLRKSGF